MVVKENIGPHSGSVINSLTFDQAFHFAQREPDKQFHTQGNGTPFTVQARTASKGLHQGTRVIVFRSNGQERARAYPCCWGARTNCNSTHIEPYTPALAEYLTELGLH
jgi:hypothetical protein